jgi:ABC-type nickel/cobalt efflux system permease component RcnA
MIEPIILFLTGLVASATHVVTGPDHLAAVTPLAIDSHKQSWKVGFSWGMGHTIGMLLIGALFLLFRKIFPPVESVEKYSDQIIGLLLILLGTWAIARTRLRHRHGNMPHTHFHTKPFLYAHFHKHSHQKNNTHEHQHTPPVKQNALTALLIGIVHGFSGFSHLVALLPLLALPTMWDSVTYIVAFALGTVLVMTGVAFILGFVAFQSFRKQKQQFLKWFTFTGGALSIVVGIIWLFEIF